MKSFDFTGLKCPLPVLKAKRVIKSMGFGDSYVFISDDPGSPIDFSHLCEMEKIEISISEKQGIFSFVITKKI